MRLAEIEAELDRLTSDELRRLALRSWTAFLRKEGGNANECNEDDAHLLAALDEAVEQAEAAPRQGCSGAEVRERLDQWSSR